MMGRLERYKIIRQTKIKYFFSFVLFFFILITGTITVDYCVNGISGNQAEIRLLSIEKVDDVVFRITFANKEFDLDTKYVSRDYNKIKSRLKNLLK